MSTVIGPFTVETADELPAVQYVNAAIPAAIAGALPPGYIHVSSAYKHPSWAYGYTPNGTHSWWSTSRHAGAHEFAHAWWYKNARTVGGNAALRALVDHPELLGTVENEHYTNRLSEAYAHAFAAAIGRPDGVREAFFRVKIPPANYGALLDLMSKALAVVTRPTHSNRLVQAIRLRQSPQLLAPVVASAVSGSVIRAAASLSGDLYELPAADTPGSQSDQWLVVVALNGSLLAAPVYTAAGLWTPETPVSPS